MRRLKFLVILLLAIGFANASFAEDYDDTSMPAVRDYDQGEEAVIDQSGGGENIDDSMQGDVQEEDEADSSIEDDRVKNFEQENNMVIKNLKKGKFTLESASFQESKKLPNTMAFNGFGCTGENLSPQLSWKNAPEDTKSFAITIYDPDAPTGSGWWHWGVYNIPVDVSLIEEGASRTSGSTLPQGAAETLTDYGTIGYGGACPPVGDKPHRYITTVYALDIERLDLDLNTTTATMLAFMLNGHTIEKASITGLYGR